MPSGFDKIVPYSYVIFLTILLFDKPFATTKMRCDMDVQTICAIVPYKVIGYILRMNVLIYSCCFEYLLVLIFNPKITPATKFARDSSSLLVLRYCCCSTAALDEFLFLIRLVFDSYFQTRGHEIGDIKRFVFYSILCLLVILAE